MQFDKFQWYNNTHSLLNLVDSTALIVFTVDNNFLIDYFYTTLTVNNF